MMAVGPESQEHVNSWEAHGSGKCREEIVSMDGSGAIQNERFAQKLELGVSSHVLRRFH